MLPSESNRWGQVMLWLATKVRQADSSSSSLTLMSTKLPLPYSAWRRLRLGKALRHGPHQDAQKSRRITLPRNSVKPEPAGEPEAWEPEAADLAGMGSAA